MTPFPRNARSEGEARYRKMLEQAPSFIWKRFADGVSLRMRMFAPRGHRPEHFAPAVMFFCGGMWSLDYTTEFVSWAVHLAHRGIVCLLPEYRTRARYNVQAVDIIGDGLDAWKWLHHNAA
jgi:acetyl esterase/lipase